MPQQNLQQLLSNEIRRLAKREINAVMGDIKARLIALRKENAAMSKRIAELEKQLANASVQPKADVPSKAESQLKSRRITPGRIKQLREKLGLSQTAFAALLGVNLNSVNHWESGKTVPRNEQKERIALLREMGKKELFQLMKEKNIIPKKSKVK